MSKSSLLALAALTVTTLFAEAVSNGASVASTDAPSLMQVQASRFAGMYFAPMSGFGFYRLRDPMTGIVEFRQEASGAFVGAGGWSAQVKGKGEAIGIRPPADDPGADYEFVFAEGSPVRFGIADREYKVNSEPGDRVCRGEVPVMWDESGSDDMNLYQRKWPGRFTVFYVNPNRTAVLFASVTLVFFALFLYASRRWLIVAGTVGTAAAAVFAVLPQSRAALLAAGIGGVVLVIGRFFRPGGRRRIVVSVVLASMLGIAMVCVGGFDRLTFERKTTDTMRETVWHEAPRMMYSAPWGVFETGVGRYYTDWFMPLKEHFFTPTMINSHYDAMIKLGWAGAFFWLFGWLGGLLSLAWWIRKGGTALPLAMWIMFGVSGVFNPVLNSWTLWLIPLATLVPFFVSRPWRDGRGYGVALGLGVVLASVVLGCYIASGRSDSRGKLAVSTSGGRVMVNGANPRVWVVDDGETLGWVQSAKEIRCYYAARPQSPALGYVRDLKLVPTGVRRLVLSGRWCAEYVELFKKGLAPRAREVIFISPPFGVAGVPFDLSTTCKFRMLVGEFAQRYVDVYGEDFSPPWVITAPGSELYVPGWVGYALSGL